MKKLVILGCTGSIGTSTLDIVRSFPSQFTVCGLTAHKSDDALKKLSKEFNCNNAKLSSKNSSAIKDVIEKSQADIVVNGIAGAAGLMPSVIALQNGLDLALANKETIVMAGSLIRDLAKKNNCHILPVDSEHSAVFNLIENYGKEAVDSVILTASGGPFRTWPKEKLSEVTPEDALKHPTWDMGAKITIDSASLANKGLEVIEACKLFDMDPSKVSVVVHPQSLIHSLIRTNDGVMYAQISKPDMRHPILSALTWPIYTKNSLEKFDLLSGSIENGLSMDFYPPRKNDFPMLILAYKALETGGSATIAYNAANEIAVDLFIHKKISFTSIASLVKKVLEDDWSKIAKDFVEVFSIDKKARMRAHELSENYQRSS